MALSSYETGAVAGFVKLAIGSPLLQVGPITRSPDCNAGGTCGVGGDSLEWSTTRASDGDTSVETTVTAMP